METPNSNDYRREHKLNFQQRSYSNKRPIFVSSHDVRADEDNLTFPANNVLVTLNSRFQTRYFRRLIASVTIKINKYFTYYTKKKQFIKLFLVDIVHRALQCIDINFRH